MRQLPPAADPTANLAYPDALVLAGVVKELSSPARLQIINTLCVMGPRRLQEIQDALGWLSQPTISHHVKDLVDAGFVEPVKNGKITRYRLVPSRLWSVIRALWPAEESFPALPPVTCDPWCQSCAAPHSPMAGSQ